MIMILAVSAILVVVTVTATATTTNIADTAKIMIIATTPAPLGDS